VPPAAAAPPPTSEPAPAPASAPSSGGYSVQVSSQRSEADAQASFRELQAKYPNQLGGREATVRRADLGAKGTYYRALVGPFASAEQAAAMCSSLKAAGGNCLVQRN
jgi:cell division septation protein DedD